MHAEHQDGDLRDALQNPPRRDQTVVPGIAQSITITCGFRLPASANRFVAVARLADDVDRRVVFEQAAKAAPDQRVIIGEQNRDLSCHVNRVIGASRRRCCLRCGTVNAHQRSAFRRPQKLDRAAEHLGALAHGDEAEPAARARPASSPVAVILHVQLDHAVLRVAAAPTRLSAPECRATLFERFLHDAVDVDAVVAVDRRSAGPSRS